MEKSCGAQFVIQRSILEPNAPKTTAAHLMQQALLPSWGPSHQPLLMETKGHCSQTGRWGSRSLRRRPIMSNTGARQDQVLHLIPGRGQRNQPDLATPLLLLLPIVVLSRGIRGPVFAHGTHLRNRLGSWSRRLLRKQILSKNPFKQPPALLTSQACLATLG